MKEFTEYNLNNIIKEYPWYYGARIMLAQKNGIQKDGILQLHLTGRPVPETLLHIPSVEDFNYQSQTDKIIDAFLAKGATRIKPSNDNDIPKGDISLQSIEETEEIYSEELAEIYLSQGLKSKACDIYSKLSLLYPEKSVYFANLIKQIENDN